MTAIPNPGPFTHVVRPRYAEVDMQRVVFNGHWLTYFDDATTRFYESLGYDPKQTFIGQQNFDVMIVKAVLEWRGSATFDDQVSITVRPERIGNKSFDLRFAASVEDRPVCEATITYVSVVPGTHEASPIPELLRQRLEGAKSAPAS